MFLDVTLYFAPVAWWVHTVAATVQVDGISAVYAIICLSAPSSLQLVEADGRPPGARCCWSLLFLLKGSLFLPTVTKCCSGRFLGFSLYYCKVVTLLCEVPWDNIYLYLNENKWSFSKRHFSVLPLIRNNQKKMQFGSEWKTLKKNRKKQVIYTFIWLSSTYFDGYGRCATITHQELGDSITTSLWLKLKPPY